jgi:O-antigen/teichoic acid export membrane protein
MLINNLLVFANNKGVDFVVGRVIGSQALGYYTVAYEISNLPTTELVYPISRAVFPGYAKIAEDKQALRTFFLRVTALITMITVPTAIGISLVADLLVHVLLGEKWVEIISLVQVLAWFGMARALHGTSGSVYVALGMPRIVAYITLVHIAVALPLLLWLMGTQGVNGAPWAILGAACVSLPLNYILVARMLHVGPRELADIVWRPGVSVSLMAAAIALFRSSWESAGLHSAIGELASSIAVGAVVYPLVVFILWRIAGSPDGAEASLLRSWLERSTRPAIRTRESRSVQ